MDFKAETNTFYKSGITQTRQRWYYQEKKGHVKLIKIITVSDTDRIDHPMNDYTLIQWLQTNQKSTSSGLSPLLFII